MVLPLGTVLLSTVRLSKLDRLVHSAGWPGPPSAHFRGTLGRAGKSVASVEEQHCLASAFGRCRSSIAAALSWFDASARLARSDSPGGRVWIRGGYRQCRGVQVRRLPRPPRRRLGCRPSRPVGRRGAQARGRGLCRAARFRTSRRVGAELYRRLSLSNRGGLQGQAAPSTRTARRRAQRARYGGMWLARSNGTPIRTASLPAQGTPSLELGLVQPDEPRGSAPGSDLRGRAHGT